MSDHAQEDFLSGVARVFRVPEHAERESVHLVLNPLDQRFESLPVPPCRPPHEVGVNHFVRSKCAPSSRAPPAGLGPAAPRHLQAVPEVAATSREFSNSSGLGSPRVAQLGGTSMLLQISRLKRL